MSATSVLMKAWKDSGQILSRVVGYWPGTRDNPPANATLVLGGYDAARGNPNLLVTMNLTDSDSEPLANVTKLEYNGPNGAVNLMEGYSDPFTVVFEMYAEHLQFVPQAYENLVKATGATFNASLNRPVYSKRPEGNIVVTLSNNFTTTIPNEEFFIKLPQLYDNGTIGEYPDTYTALIGNITTPGQPMLWGRPYLSMNYIIFDYSRNQMQLTPAQRTLTLNEGTGKQLRPICEPQNTTSPTPTLVTSSSGGGGGSNHAGAIAGGVVGGIVGLALILGLAWSLLRRRRKTKNGNGFHDKPELENTEVAGAAMKKQSVATTVGGELDSGAYAEMDAGQSPKQELDSAVIGVSDESPSTTIEDCN